MDYSKIIKTLNPKNAPVSSCDAFIWWSAGGYAFNRIQAKRNYLRSLGFRKGADTIDQESINLLNLIASAVYDVKFRLIKKRFNDETIK